ncbi:MAG TPA: PKD domain-containing protein [Vicinamibacterales bacterium]|nr:PKD domain-containing protein [Vicinamibacterales bacterium]
MKRSFAGLAVLCLIAALSLAVACDKVPLLAPTGSVISVFASANTVPLNGDIEIIANVIENGTAQSTPTTPTNGTPGTGTTGTTSTTTTGAGTPVQNGTLVSFTTTIGRIEPSEARTSNGQVRVRFFSGNQSGTATITAFSGGASGKLENLKVGAAAVERVTLSASPQTLPPGGGTSTITARVEDVSGLGLSGIPVTFTTDNGSLNPPTATTDSNGVATTSLNAPRTAKVTANVAGKTADVTVSLSPRTGLSITAPTTAVSAGLPASFTVNVAATANIQNVIVDFGDGSQQPLGAISGSTVIQHVYRQPGTFTVRATATDASGFNEQVATAVTILPAQPPAVTITGPATASCNARVTFTASVSGAVSSITSYEWDFGDGSATTTVSSPQISHTYTKPSTFDVRVTVTQSTGPVGQGQTSITVNGPCL